MRRLRKNVAVKLGRSGPLTLNEKLTFVIGVCSVIVAVGSVIIGYLALRVASDSTDMKRAVTSLEQQLQETTEHDRMMALEAAAFLMEVNDDKEVGIYIENNGPGPAYLRELKIYVNGKRLKGTSEIWKAWSGSEKLLLNPPSYHEFNVGRLIRAGEKWSLLYVDRKNVRDMLAFKTSLHDDIFMVGETCDLYWKCKMLCTKGEPDKCKVLEAQIEASASGSAH
jgi:hypothetical protein